MIDVIHTYMYVHRSIYIYMYIYIYVHINICGTRVLCASRWGYWLQLHFRCRCRGTPTDNVLTHAWASMPTICRHCDKDPSRKGRSEIEPNSSAFKTKPEPHLLLHHSMKLRSHRLLGACVGRTGSFRTALCDSMFLTFTPGKFPL